ncbi:hypothetical protein GJU39_21375 [Pedobacter petrophilus]|uniref:Uncharacterized protein n=1 Tax=Pedobacter petrophilus TaxID=1908241 RepID=A0A7K0G4A4_9SPHI|nr:hypothetical protein [Pedobacter petrophilus]MRX78635.1 hypothetical protein [Pedobacter petrophilus]
MMIAREYEYLLSKVYCGGMFSQYIMNAGGYLQMQQEYNNLNAFETATGQMEKEYVFRKSFLIIRNYVQQAIKDGLKNFQLEIQADGINKLSYMTGTSNQNFFDKKSLDQIIGMANPVFKQYSLKN